MKSGQFMSYYKRKKKLSKNSTKTAISKVPGPFVFTKNLAQLLLENEIFEASYLNIYEQNYQNLPKSPQTS